jgi:hypothetical protein
VGIRRQSSFDSKTAMKMRADENYERFQTPGNPICNIARAQRYLKLLKELAAVDVNHATKAH